MYQLLSCGQIETVTHQDANNANDHDHHQTHIGDNIHISNSIKLSNTEEVVKKLSQIQIPNLIGI